MKKRTKAFISLLLVAIFTLINHTQARVGYLISQDNEGVLQQTINSETDFSHNHLPANLKGLPERQADGEVIVVKPKFMPTFVLGIEGEKLYETVPLADTHLYQIPEGDYWFETLEAHMQVLTSEFEFLSHLATEWTLDSTDSHR